MPIQKRLLLALEINVSKGDYEVTWLWRPDGDFRGADDRRDDKQTETRPDKSEIYRCTLHVLPRFLPRPARMFQKYAMSWCLHGKVLNFP